MTYLIGRGRYKGEGYPLPRAAAASGGGFWKRIGFDNNVSATLYNTGDSLGPILKQPAGAPVSVTLTGFTPGNLILVSLSVTGKDAIASGATNSNMTLTPLVDIGAGDQRIDTPPLTSNTTPGTFQPIAWVSFVVPVSDQVTAAPVVKIGIEVGGADQCRIDAFGALLIAAEVDASSPLVTQLPSTVLLPP